MSEHESWCVTRYSDHRPCSCRNTMPASREAVFEKVLRRLPLPDRAAFRQEYGAAWRDEDGRASAEPRPDRADPERRAEGLKAQIAALSRHLLYGDLWVNADQLGRVLDGMCTCSVEDDNAPPYVHAVECPAVRTDLTPPPAGNES